MTARPADSAAPELAWLIERGQPEGQVPTVWWADRKRWGLTYMDDWTDDAFKAFRFASREAAEEVITAKFTPPASRGGPSARAVEHGFIRESADSAAPVTLRDAAREVVRFYGTDRTWSLAFRTMLGSRIDDLDAALAIEAEAAAAVSAREGELDDLRAWVRAQRAKPWSESGSFASRMTGEEGYDAALEELEYRLG